MDSSRATRFNRVPDRDAAPPLWSFAAMRDARADRNLLLGILALQMDFITRDALIAAMNAWVLDKGKTLGQILLDAGAIDAPAINALETMVDLHIARHGGEPEHDDELGDHPGILGSDAIDEQPQSDPQGRAGKDGHSHHEALLLRVQVQGFADLRPEWSEHRPDHEGEVEVEKGREQGRPMPGAFECG